MSIGSCSGANAPLPIDLVRVVRGLSGVSQGIGEGADFRGQVLQSGTNPQVHHLLGNKSDNLLEDVTEPSLFNVGEIQQLHHHLF